MISHLLEDHENENGSPTGMESKMGAGNLVINSKQALRDNFLDHDVESPPNMDLSDREAHEIRSESVRQHEQDQLLQQQREQRQYNNMLLQ